MCISSFFVCATATPIHLTRLSADPRWLDIPWVNACWVRACEWRSLIREAKLTALPTATAAGTALATNVVLSNYNNSHSVTSGRIPVKISFFFRSMEKVPQTIPVQWKKIRPSVHDRTAVRVRAVSLPSIFPLSRWLFPWCSQR